MLSVLSSPSQAGTPAGREGGLTDARKCDRGDQGRHGDGAVTESGQSHAEADHHYSNRATVMAAEAQAGERASLYCVPTEWRRPIQHGCGRSAERSWCRVERTDGATSA